MFVAGYVVTGQSSTTGRAEGESVAGSESVFLHLSVHGGLADAEQLRGGKNASSRHLESLLQCRLFQVAKVEGFWESQ